DRLRLCRRHPQRHGARTSMPRPTGVVQDPARLHPDGGAPADGARQGAEASAPTSGRGARTPLKTPLNRQQVVGVWAGWAGWLLDGMDSVIYALVLAPALTELLPRSGLDASPRSVASVGSLLFALFLVGWGCSFIWGPIA